MEHDERNRYEAIIMQKDAIIADLEKRVSILRETLKAVHAPEAVGYQPCEFCKGLGTVPAKTPWSPESVLGRDNDKR